MNAPPANAREFGREVVRFEAVGHDRGGAFKHRVRELDFAVHAREAVVLTGPLGCGKSTLLRAVIGQEKPTSGRVLIEGRDPFEMDDYQLEELRTRIGYMPEDGALLSNLNLFENLVLPLRYHRGPPEDEVRFAAKETLRLLGIGELPHAIPPTTSRAMCQLVALARTLILRPVLLVLDAPVLGMDEPTARGVWRTLNKLRVDLDLAILIAADFPPNPANLQHTLVDLGKKATPWDATTRVVGDIGSPAAEPT